MGRGGLIGIKQSFTFDAYVVRSLMCRRALCCVVCPQSGPRGGRG